MDLDAEMMRIKKRFGAIEARLDGAVVSAPSNLSDFEQRLQNIEAIIQQLAPMVEQVATLIQEVAAIKAGLPPAPPMA